jgi:hypothetical protein
MKAETSKIKTPADSVSHEGLFLADINFYKSSHGRKNKRSPSEPFTRALIPP